MGGVMFSGVESLYADLLKRTAEFHGTPAGKLLELKRKLDVLERQVEAIGLLLQEVSECTDNLKAAVETITPADEKG